MKKVQIICVTYNQAPYIGQALDSFLMQKTDFDFEVLVGDDCSTDETSQIVAEYAQKYPDRIRHILRRPNMGCLQNFMDLIDHATAPYLALCDGDDYWTDETKLQQQVNILDNNPDINICAHLTHISASTEWALYNFYKKQNFTIPKRCKLNTKLHLSDIINEWPHTSSFLARRNVTTFPVWAKTDGVGGDMPFLFLQLGSGAIYIINKVMSVYRRGAGGVIDNNKSMEDLFLKTRLEYFKILLNSRDYFIEHYNSFQIAAFEARIWTEIKNFINTIINSGNWDRMAELRDKYPEVYEKAKSLLLEYKFRIKAIHLLGKNSADLLYRNDKVLNFIGKAIPLLMLPTKIKTGLLFIIKWMAAFIMYWCGALVPKNKKLWVFSGFFKKSYCDNTKYFFEFICKNHPEIKAVWLSENQDVIRQLKEKGLPVKKMKSLSGMFTMLKAAVAVTDHFKGSDYSTCFGFNARTKLVNLWHGAGLKCMLPQGDTIPNTHVTGVRLSSDIFPQPGDNVWTRFKKKLRYPFVAPWRELFEKYFLVVCANQHFIDIWARPLRCPESSWFRCGYPRNVGYADAQQNENDIKKVLFAPTYRMKADDEKMFLDNFLSSIPTINEILEKCDAIFVLRLHPHTWRNYTSKIQAAIADYPRFTISSNPDIYGELFSYNVLVSDYSSIIQDYMIVRRPIVYAAVDKEKFFTSDCGVNIPYEENCAGPVCYNWHDVATSIEDALIHPEHYAGVLEKIGQKFCPKSYNDSNNSERITCEIKNKLGIK